MEPIIVYFYGIPFLILDECAQYKNFESSQIVNLKQETTVLSDDLAKFIMATQAMLKTTENRKEES